jgi:hypothetical protein
LRRARRDAGFPAVVSLLAIRRAWLVSARAGVRVLSAVPWTALLPGQNSGSQSVIDIWGLQSIWIEFNIPDYGDGQHD